MNNKVHDGIIILGHPRSGTTLLRRLLNGHKHIACPGETHILNACARFIHAEYTADGVDMGVLAGLHFAGFNEEDIITKLREFAYSYPRTYAANHGKTMWAEKTAEDAFHIKAIDKIFGNNAYFIGIIRHGLDVAVSCKDFTDATGVYLENFHKYIQQTTDPLEAFSNSWVDVNSTLIEFAEKHPDNCLLCRYEDLIKNPKETLEALLEMVGEQVDDEMLNSLKQETDFGFSDHKSYQTTEIVTTSIERWRSLPEGQIRKLGKIINETLEQCGYDTIDTDSNDDNENAARRRYEMSLMLHTKQRSDNDDKHK